MTLVLRKFGEDGVAPIETCACRDLSSREQRAEAERGTSEESVARTPAAIIIDQDVQARFEMKQVVRASGFTFAGEAGFGRKR